MFFSSVGYVRRCPLSPWVLKGLISWGWVEDGGVATSFPAGFGQAIEGLQDDTSGTVLAVLGLVAAEDDREGIEDVRRIVAAETVEVEEGSIQLAAQEEAAGLIPPIRRAVLAAVAGER
jgi:hypothetical protein